MTDLQELLSRSAEIREQIQRSKENLAKLNQEAQEIIQSIK